MVYDVVKEECINHVSKRIYNCLGTAKKKFGYNTRECIDGKGRMTDKMRDFQSYYGKAVRTHSKGWSD